MDGLGEEEAPAAPAAAQVQLCGACHQPNEGRAHSCAQCGVNLHSHVLCRDLWMPVDGVQSLPPLTSSKGVATVCSGQPCIPFRDTYAIRILLHARTRPWTSC